MVETSSLRATVRIVVFVILAVSALVDLSGDLSLGPISGQGALTIGYFLAGLMLLSLSPSAKTRGGPHWLPLLGFVIWICTSLLWSMAPLRGIQNVLAIGTFAILMRVSEAVSSFDPHFAFWQCRILRYSVLSACALYATSVLWFGPGTGELFGARSFGAFALFGVAIFLAQWRYGSRSGLIAALAITVLIGISQSRLALGIALILFPLAQMPTSNFWRTLKAATVTIVVAATFYAAFQWFDSLRDRFVTGDVSLRIGSIAVNGSGRRAFWLTTIESLQDSPWIGKGAGSNEGLIESVFVTIRHPHSDYLRIAHDYGIIGSVLWVFAIGGIFRVVWTSWRRADRCFRSGARLQLTALLSLIAFILHMSAENALVYLFIAAPLGLLLGSATGLEQLTIAASRKGQSAG